MVGKLNTSLKKERKRVKITPKLCEIDHLYPPLHFGIKNTPAVFPGNHKYPQELTAKYLVTWQAMWD